jgi:hypothetical protein
MGSFKDEGVIGEVSKSWLMEVEADEVMAEAVVMAMGG